MAKTIKNQEEILKKLGITELNQMQTEAKTAIHNNANSIILSPTGSGKTLAFLLPLIAELDPDSTEIQAMVLAPTRELALQIEAVIREMGSGYKANAVYGGRSGAKDRMDLRHLPAILIGTPGRIADRMYRDGWDSSHIKTLILDEFDKSLEIGFEEEMEEIIEQLEGLEKRILTSATQAVEIPDFVGLDNPIEINFLKGKSKQLSLKTVASPDKDKLPSLIRLIRQQNGGTGIVFCNFKDAIQRVSTYLNDNHIEHGCFHGSMEQQDRERALIQFRNGSHNILLATDLAARGIDVPEIDYIIHYHLPHHEEEFIHRNGRTARMHQSGTAYVLHWKSEALPDFITAMHPEKEALEEIHLENQVEKQVSWTTLLITGGRRDKISKGDIVGLFIKQGGLENDQIGTIELKQECAFVAVNSNEVDRLLSSVDNSKLKKKKVRIRKV